MKVLDLIQGSKEWLDARYDYITATDVPTILDLNPYETALELFERKYQRQEKIFDPFTQQRLNRGHEFEREMSEVMDIEFKPVITHIKYPHLMASLDGYHSGLVYEFKYSEKPVIEIPPEHEAQVQTQMLLSDTENAWYIRGTSKNNLQQILVKRDIAQQQAIVEESLKFMNKLQEGKAPEPTDRDYLVIDDPIMLELGMAKDLVKIYQDLVDKHLEALLEKYKHKLITNGLISIVKSSRKGSIPYSKLEEVKALDLEKYRGKDTEVVTVRIKK